MTNDQACSIPPNSSYKLNPDFNFDTILNCSILLRTYCIEIEKHYEFEIDFPKIANEEYCILALRIFFDTRWS